jgi:hypothetical protein
MSVLKNGLLIPAGVMCPFVDGCEFKYVACNGDGCPFAKGYTSDLNFSCGAARFFDLLEEREDVSDED